MRLFLIIFILSLITLASGQRMHTAMLPPSVDNYGESYFVMIHANQRRLCQTGWICDDHPLVIKPMLDAYRKCGFHSFRTYTDNYIFSANVTLLPHRVTMSAFLQSRESFELGDCIFTFGAYFCMPKVDRTAVECVRNTTMKMTIPERVCVPWWTMVIVMGLLCLIVSTLVLIFRDRCRERFKFLAVQDIDMDSDYEVLLNDPNEFED